MRIPSDCCQDLGNEHPAGVSGGTLKSREQFGYFLQHCFERIF